MLALLKGLGLPLTLVTGREMVFARLDPRPWRALCPIGLRPRANGPPLAPVLRSACYPLEENNHGAVSQTYRDLTGAGISAESGIKTFRACDGLWEEHRVEDVATPEGYARDPELVQRFTMHGAISCSAPRSTPIRPTMHWPVWSACCRGASPWSPRTSTTCTRVPAARTSSTCTASCSRPLPGLGSGDRVARGSPSGKSCVPCCQFPTRCAPCGLVGGRCPRTWTASTRPWLSAIFISIGTSGAVYPAAGFVHEAGLNGAHTVELNLEPSEVGSQFDENVMVRLPCWCPLLWMNSCKVAECISLSPSRAITGWRCGAPNY